MRKPQRVSVGDLVAAAYEAAGQQTRDERATSVLAACAVSKLLLRAGRPDLALELEQSN
jgi:hypothetical protein